MDPAVQPAARVAVRALVDQVTTGCRPPTGELVETLIRELVTAGHWTPVERARIDGLRGDGTLAELIGQALDGGSGPADQSATGRPSADPPPADPGHRLVRYVASVVQPTVPQGYRARVEAGLRLLAGSVAEPDADRRR